MTKQEVLKLLVLIEAVYTSFILKNDTVQHWLEISYHLNYEKVLKELYTFMKKSPYPPTIADLREWEEEKRAQIRQTRTAQENIDKSKKTNQAWMLEYSLR